MNAEIKYCPKCEIVKPTGLFYKHKRDGLQSYCKVCVKEASKGYARKYHSRHNQWTKYRLRPDDISKMLEQQNGVCKLCKGGFGNKAPYVDHDHNCCSGDSSCGKCVRSLLCMKCNLLVGHVEKNLTLIPLIMEYIRER